MKLLLDTHALIWFLAGKDQLSAVARDAIRDSGNFVLVSAVSAMEITTKFRLGKLPEAAMLAEDFENQIAIRGFHALPLEIVHAVLAGSLAIPHKDPFDRMLIAQAQLEKALLVSNEAIFDGFGVRRLW